MRELVEFARRGPLRGFFLEPPRPLLPEEGTIGIALRYDSTLVQLIANVIASRTSVRSLEGSTRLAAALAAIANADDGYEADGIDEDFLLYQSWREWKGLSIRRFGRDVSPIVIEIALRTQFKYSEPLPVFFHRYRIAYRQPINVAHLQYAEAGGRFIPGWSKRGFLGNSYLKRASNKWGTLGGFLRTLNGDLFGVTAAHVMEDSQGWATPAFSSLETLGVRSIFQSISARGPGELQNFWSAERGVLAADSKPDLVAPGQCKATFTPMSGGLDLALIRFPRTELSYLRPVEVAGIGQVSQLLPAHFWGAKTGFRRVRFSSLSIWYSYELPSTSKFACTSDCFQIALSSRPYFRTNLSERGDSGAWVVADASDRPYWVGVLVGGDGERSGVVPAERIISHFTQELGPLTALM